MQSLNHIIKDSSSIDNWKKEIKPIDNCTIGVSKNAGSDVDQLLKDCSDLIVSGWQPYFAKKFYSLNKDRVLVLASQARQDARTSPQRLFSYLISREAK